MSEISVGSWVILATQVVTLIGSIVSISLALRNRHAIQEVHLSLNSRLSQLLESQSAASRAEGAAQAMAEVAVRDARK